MPKGCYTQGVCLLTNGQPTIDVIKPCLVKQAFDIVKETSSQKDWYFSGPSLVISFLPEVNGYASIDVVGMPWPDSMGDLESEPMLFGSWAMGNFGPFTFPGGLARAQQHVRTLEPKQTPLDSHAGFIRIRISYLFGCRPETPVFPNDYDALAELNFLNRLVLTLFETPGVLCYFNPNGEVLCDRNRFHDVWKACREQKTIPLPLWANVRLFDLDDKFGFMDTVGNGQLDVSDIEAVFPKSEYAPGDVDYYLRNVTHYLLDSATKIQSGDTFDGPEETSLLWTAELLDAGLTDPPRPVLRLYPNAHEEAVRAALAKFGQPSK
jgi:hypothetical protein